MSEISDSTETGDSVEIAVQYTDEKPAIGLVATGDNTDAIARALLRGVHHGHRIIVIWCADTPPETLGFTDTDHVHFIDPSRGTDTDAPRQMLSTAARALEIPGVIFHGEARRQIDYESSVSAFDETEYCIDAVPQLDAPDGRSSATLVAIPAYNEALAIGGVVTAALEQVDQVLVIDDGSTDDTVARASEAGATVIEHESNGGYGAALKTAFVEAEKHRVEQLVILDGDGQHDPADIPRLVGALRDGDADIAIGSRFAAGSDTTIPFYRRIGLAVVNLLSNLSLGVVRSESWINDTQSGYRAYDRRAIRSLLADDGIGDRMGASTDILYHAHHNDYSIEEVGTTIDYEIEDGSHHNPVSHGVHLVMNIVKTVERDRPITFLGVPGFLSAFVGLGFGYWTISNYISTNGFPIGLAITSMFFVLIGVFACFSAVMLHALSTQLRE